VHSNNPQINYAIMNKLSYCTIHIFCALIVILICCQPIQTSAQSITIKTYNGPFKDGTARYQYYENENGERMYNGFFEYENAKRKQRLSGYFKNNIIDSVWRYYINNGIVSTIQFKNGLRDGKWSYKEKRVDKNESTKYYGSVEVELTAFFKQNTLDGNLSFQFRKDEITPYKKEHTEKKLTGSFKDGLLSGEWVMTGDNTPFTEKYFNGIWYYSKEKDNSTGEVLIKTDSALVFNCLSVLDNGVCTVNDVKYKIVMSSNYSSDHESEITNNITESSMNMLGDYVAWNSAGSVFTLWGFKGWMGKSWDSIHSLFGVSFKQISEIEAPMFPIRWIQED